MSRKKWAIVGAVAVVAAVAVGVGIMLSGNHTTRAQANGSPTAAETLIAQKLGITPETLQAVETAALDVAGDKGTTAGVLQPGQASALKALDLGPILDSTLNSLASTLKTTPQGLIDSLANGSSLAQVASTTGVTTDQLKSGLTSLLQTQLTDLQGKGVITSAQSTMASSFLSANLDKLINATPQHKAGSTTH